ncbi:hypothetical protein HMPREF9445_02467 [Bacteroides clarus YIT 12056]|uniref:Uncharacterized protein n=1 Tax=Bacteroides clarus YIT 12056 TaxID=762984 RepID=A0ABP2KPL1_9BACE|nr:hypothetical protein HMPREF9445_02467 [Bacteroides clarus YIT 12056]
MEHKDTIISKTERNIAGEFFVSPFPPSRKVYPHFSMERIHFTCEWSLYLPKI